MISKISSATIQGIDAFVVTVETDVGDGLPAFDMVGLLSSKVREARERVRTALKNTGFLMPPKRITINIAPADIRKTGTYFDLPIAMSILIGIGMIQEDKLKNSLMVGELSLDGRVVKGNGILPIVLKAKEENYKRCYVPRDNLYECSMVKDVDIIGISNLRELVFLLESGKFGISEEKFSVWEETDVNNHKYEYDFSQIKGQVVARRAAEITAAGMHNMLMVGAPGAGKSMIAKCIPSILPALNEKEKMEVAKIQSIAGIIAEGEEIVRPFRSPHHSCTTSSLIGGGANPKPGEITLAHKGVLFLDELTEFSSKNIDVLRQPLEEGYVSISRVSGKYKFPADFIFLGACNPCKCGYYPDRNKCKCTEMDVKKYMDKISGPIMDRMDICVQIEPVKFEEIDSNIRVEDSLTIRNRVEKARMAQEKRYRNINIIFNSQLDGRHIGEYCPLGKKEKGLMEMAFNKLGLSIRSYYRIIKVARTIADLEGEENIGVKHLSEAMVYRM